MTAIWLEVGGAASSITDAACQRLYALGARGVHCVTPDMSTNQAQINSIKKFGMTGTLDIEVPLWDALGENVNTDLTPYLPQLQAQAAAGWSYFSAEGIGRAGVATIGSVKPYINYGDEYGANMYGGQYNHAANAHFANLLETYHKSAISAYLASSAIAKANCPRYGLTLMMYNPSDLEQDTTALINYINQVGGVQNVMMWCNSDIQSVFNQPWLGIVEALKTAFGFRTDLPWTTVTPPPPVSTVASAPATCLDPAGNVNVFTVASDKTCLWRQKKVDGTWIPRTSLGGICTSPPCAILGPSGVIHLFVRGSDGGVWTKYMFDNQWSTLWTSIGGQTLAGTGVSAVSISETVFEVWCTGQHNDVYVNVYNGTTWSGWIKQLSPEF